MDPVTQVLAQQQSGSAGGQGFGQFFVAGQQNARQREQLNLANRAETRMQARQQQQLNLANRSESRLQARQQALLPYEQSLMASQIVAAGQLAEFNRQKQLTMLQQNHAMPQILELESYFMQSPLGHKDPDGIAAYKQLYSQYPQAFAEGGPGHSLRMRVQMPTLMDAEMDRLEEARRRFPNLQRLDPKTGGITLSPRYDTELVTETDPSSGRPRTFLRDATGRMRTVPEDIGARQREAFQRAEGAKDVAFVREHNPQGYAESMGNVDTERGGLPTVTPAARNQAAKMAGMQGATKTLIEQQNMGAENVVNIGRRLLPLLTSANVGPKGWFKREVVARVPGVSEALSPFMDVNSVDDAVAAETLGRQFLGQIFKAIRSDSNINEKEYAQIVKAAPTPDALFTKPEAEKRKLLEFLISSRDLARSNAGRTGKPISEFFLTPQELEARIAAGDYTADQAAAIYNNSGTALIDILRAEAEARTR